jgi:hypothetical protein
MMVQLLAAQGTSTHQKKAADAESVTYLYPFAKQIDCSLLAFSAAYLRIPKVWDDTALQRRVMMQ